MTTWQPVPILMSHAVELAPRDPEYKHFYVIKSEFEWQMRRLKQLGYAPVTFQMLADAMAGSATLPNLPVLITFDDGYKNLLTNVHPFLAELGYPYTVFLVSDKIGKTNDWVAAEGYDPDPLLSWQEIKEMASAGFASFQPHTANHLKLTETPSNIVLGELQTCRAALEQQFAYPMDVLCYPYGNYNAEIVRIAQDVGYKMAVTTNFGRVRQNDKPLELPRISVYHVPPISLTYGIGTMNFDWRLRTRKDGRE
jgi:peptidoglycan/xylan/chitin deacetylase (PgdA/CDA1 family)